MEQGNTLEEIISGEASQYTQETDFAISKEMAATLWADMLKQALHDFLELTGMAKTDFAQQYECTPQYLSRMLSGVKAVNESAFFRVVMQHRYTVTIHINTRKIEFKKTPQGITK
jgi:hypothetical protein